MMGNMSKRHSISSFFSNEITQEQSDSHLILSSTTHSFKSSIGKRKNVFIKMFQWTSNRTISSQSCIDYGIHQTEYQRESLISDTSYNELNQSKPEKPPSLYSQSDILNSYHNLDQSIEKLSKLMELCQDHVDYYKRENETQDESTELCVLEGYMNDILNEWINEGF